MTKIGEYMTDNDNKTFLILGITGIVLGFFAYLVYMKSKEREHLKQMSLPQVQNTNMDEVYSKLDAQQSQLDYIINTLSYKNQDKPKEIKPLTVNASNINTLTAKDIDAARRKQFDMS